MITHLSSSFFSKITYFLKDHVYVIRKNILGYTKYCEF